MTFQKYFIYTQQHERLVILSHEMTDQYEINNHKYQMQILALVGILYFLIGACVCLLICANPNDPGVIGKLRSFVFNTIPTKFSNVVRKVFGEGVLNKLGYVKVYLMETNHPLVQWFYYLIAVGGFMGYTYTGILKHMPNRFVPDACVIIAYVMAGICFWVYYKACSVSPGQITEHSSEKFTKEHAEHYDGVMYKQKNKCTTCNTIKPARSKHCNICKMCVSKFDHHCIWIRQCVGQKNYKYFVAFLFLHSIWCSYLSVIGTLSLYAALEKMRFWEHSFRIGNQIVKANNLLALQYLFTMETFFFFINVMCAIMGITLFIFVCYHFYLIGQGQTTNQRVKKNDWIDYLRKQLKAINKFEKQNPKLPNEILFKKQKMNPKQFEEYKEDCSQRLAILQKQLKNPGFIANMKKVFSQPDK